MMFYINKYKSVIYISVVVFYSTDNAIIYLTKPFLGEILAVSV